MFSLMKIAPRRTSDEVKSAEAYYEMCEDKGSQKRREKKKREVPDQKGAEL